MRTVKDPAERKKELVMAATDLFIKNGYEKTTVENIINRVGVAKGCFYHYFRSKEEVFEECITSLTYSIANSYLSILTDGNMNAKQKLLSYIDYNFQLAKQDRSEKLFEAIHSETFEKMHNRIMKDTVKQVMPAFIQLIEQGKADSGFNVINTEFTAAALLGAFQEIHNVFSYNTNVDTVNKRDLIYDLMEGLLKTSFR